MRTNLSFRILWTVCVALCAPQPSQSNGLGCATVSEDGSVGFDDLTVVLSQWNTPNGDANQDGTTNFPDLILVLSDFNRDPFSWMSTCNSITRTGW